MVQGQAERDRGRGLREIWAESLSLGTLDIALWGPLYASREV